jgi:hypothetical protein
MSKLPVYRGNQLAKNSQAYALWHAWQSAKADRNTQQKSLDNHMKALEQQYQMLLTRYDKS